MKFTPAASIFTTASFDFGCGTGKSTSSMTSGPPVRLTCMAFIFGFDVSRTM
jgi:trans-aconitate methyltransferase